MPNRSDFEGDITPSYHNEDPTSDYRTRKILSGVPRQTYNGSLFDKPTVNDNGVLYYDTDVFHQQVRDKTESRSNALDTEHSGLPRLRVDEESSTSEFTRLIQSQDNEADKFFDVRMDRQTGAMSVNNALNPSGGYFSTASAFLSTDVSDPDRPFNINSAKTNFWDALADPRGPVVGLQQRGGLYNNYEELSPQRLSNIQNSIYMPNKDMLGEEVALRDSVSMQKRLEFQINMQRGVEANREKVTPEMAIFARKGDENHLVNVNAALASSVPFDENANMVGIASSKKVSLMGGYETFLKLSMDNQRLPQTQMSMNLTDATDAPIGYAERHRNRLLAIGTPEGAAEREEGKSQWARSNTYRIPLDRFDQLGLSAGQSFEGGAIPGIHQTEGGNYVSSIIQSVERDEDTGFASVVVDRTVNEVNSKFMGLKAFDHNVGDGGIPEGIDLVTRLGSEKDFSMRIAALYMSDTAVKADQRDFAGNDYAGRDFVNYLANNLGMDRDQAAAGFNQGNVRPEFKQHVFGAAMNYFKGHWFGERYDRTVGADEVQRYMDPGQKLSDFSFDDEGNVLNHPSMLRHDISDPAGMANVFGSSLINDLTEAGTGKGLEKMRVKRRTEDGRYIVEARDVSLDSHSIMRNRPEFSSTSHVFGPDELNVMASANPALYQNLQDLDRRGVLKNYAREIVQSSLTNRGQDVNLGYGNPGGVMNALNMTNAAGEPITYSGIRDQIRAGSPDYMNEDEIAKQSLWELHRQTGGARLRIGNDLFGSAGAMATNFQLDDEGQSVNTLGTHFANVLDLRERFAGDDDNRDAHEAIVKATSSLKAAHLALAEQPSIRKQAAGIVSGVFGGPQVSNSGLALNEIAYNREDFRSSLAGLSTEEQEARMGEFDDGFAVSSFTMYPHSDSSSAFLNLRAVDASKVREREGMGDFFVRPGGSVPHPIAVQIRNKDGDADFGFGIPYRGDRPSHPMTEAQMMEMANRSTGGEDVNALGVANRQVLDLFQGSQRKTVTGPDGRGSGYTVASFADEMDDTQQHKIMMGPNYNAGQREAMLFKREMIARANLPDDQKEALVQAAGKSASSPYQQQLDMKDETDVSTNFLLKARSNLSQPTLGVNGDNRLAGQASFFNIDNPDGPTNVPGFKEPLRISEQNGMQDFASFMISKMATQFMGRDNYLSHAPENPGTVSDVPGLVRDVAQNLLPMNVANDEGRINAMSSFLGRIHGSYNALREGKSVEDADRSQLEYRLSNKDMNEFLTLAAPADGKKRGAQDYFFGNKNLAPEDRAMAPSVWNAYTARRAAYKKTYYGGENDKGEPDQFSEPPNDDWELGSTMDEHGVDRKWFRRNITTQGLFDDQGNFQGLGGNEGNRMALLRDAYYKNAKNEGSVPEQSARNRLIAVDLPNAAAHSRHLADENILGTPIPRGVQDEETALAVFGMNEAKPNVWRNELRQVFDPAIGAMTPVTPLGRPPVSIPPEGAVSDEVSQGAALIQQRNAAQQLMRDVGDLPYDHPDRLVARQLYQDAADNALGYEDPADNIDMLNHAMGGQGNGGQRPPNSGTAAPAADPGGNGNRGDNNSHNTTYFHNTTTQYRAQPPTIPEVESLRGQLSFLDGFQGITDPRGLSHAQQGSLMGAVTSIQKLMARGESSIRNGQTDPGTRYYDDVMNGGENTLKHDLLTTMDDLQPLVAAISPVYEETRLNMQYGKGLGVVGQMNEAERFIHATGSHIEGLLTTLGDSGAGKDERGVARFQLERFQQMVNLGVSEGAPTTPGQEHELDRIGQAVTRSTNEGVRNVTPLVADEHTQRAQQRITDAAQREQVKIASKAQRDQERADRAQTKDDEAFNRRYEAYEGDQGEISSAEDILNNLRPVEITDMMDAARKGNPEAIKKLKGVQKQMHTISQYSDIGTQLPEHVENFVQPIAAALQSGEFEQSQGRGGSNTTAKPQSFSRPDDLRLAVANAAQNFLGRNMDDVPKILEELKKGITGIGEVSEETTKKAQNFVKAYRDSNNELENAIQTREGGGNLSLRQQTLLGSDTNEQARARLGAQSVAASNITSALYDLGNQDEQDDTSLGGRLKNVGSSLYNRAIRGQGLFHAKLAIGALVSPAIDAARGYLDDQAAQGQMLFQTGQASFDDLMAGSYGMATRREAQSAQGQLAYGRQVMNAYGPVVNAAVGPGTANGPLGALAAIGLPALGVGIAATSLTGNPLIGGVAAAGTFAVGAEGYINSAAKSMYEMGQSQNEGVGSMFSNFQGYVGNVQNSWFKNVLAAPLRIASVVSGHGDIKFDNLPSESAIDYTSIVDKYAAGKINRADMEEEAGVFHFNTSNINNQAITNIKSSMAEKYGLSPDDAQAALVPWEVFSPNRQPNDVQQKSLAQSKAAGFNLFDATIGALQGAGIAPGTPQASSIMESILSTANQQPNQETYGVVLKQLQDSTAGVQQAQRRAALNNNGSGPLISYVDVQAQATGINSGTINSDVQASQNQLAGMAAQVQISNPSYYALATKNALQAGGSADFAYNRGMFQQGDQIQQNVQQNMPSFTQAQAYGANAQTLGAWDSINLITDPAQEYMAQQITGGNRYAISNAIQNGRLPRKGTAGLNTMNVQTGMGIFDTGGFQPADMQALESSDVYSQFRLDNTDRATFVKDGTRGLKNTQRVEGYAYEDFNRITGQMQQALGYQMQTGFDTAGGVKLDGQGFASGGGQQSILAGLYQKYNLGQYNPGNGMSQYQAEDAQTKLSREQQQFGLTQQGQSLQIDRASYDLSGQQFNENFSLQKQQFQFQTGFQREQMDIGREHQVTQQGWAREDLAYSRDQLQIHNAWSMQDYDRDIRYARGKDKRDLIRERGRQTVEYAMEMGQQDRQENREGVQEGWSQQLFDKQKGYFEQNVAFETQKMALQQKQFGEDRSLQDQRLKLSEQAHQKQMTWLTQQFALEDQQRLQTRQAAEAQRAIQQDINTRTNEYVVRTRALADGITFADQRTAEWNSKISVMAVDGTLATIATGLLNTSLGNLTTSAQRAAQAVAQVAIPGVVAHPGSPNPAHGQQAGGPAGASNPLNPFIGQSQRMNHEFIAGYQAGGFTGYAANNQPVGVVHGGEYVVPANGALVMRDDDLLSLVRMVVELLRTSNQSLNKIASNPVRFEANFNGAPQQSQDIYQQSRSWL